DGIFNRSLARFDDAGATNAGNAAIVLRACRYLALQPTGGNRVGGAWIREAPSAATRVAFAASGAYRRITVADREIRVVATAAVKPGLGIRRLNWRPYRQNERGRQPKWKSHARPLEFENR